MMKTCGRLIQDIKIKKVPNHKLFMFRVNKIIKNQAPKLKGSAFLNSKKLSAFNDDFKCDQPVILC